MTINREITIFFVVFASIIVAVLLFEFVFVEKIPPDALTRTRMCGIEYRIRDYYAKERRLPENLSVLPELRDDNRDYSLADGWGRPIQYTIEGRTVSLLSWGKDGRPGGNGQDADITVTFTVSEESEEGGRNGGSRRSSQL